MSDLASKLASYFQQRGPEAAYGHAAYWYNEPLTLNPTQADVERLARAFADDTVFQALRLGTWLSTPDGRLVAAAVRQVLPMPYRPYERLFVAALTQAAQMQARGERKKALGWLAGAGSVAATGLAIILAGRAG